MSMDRDINSPNVITKVGAKLDEGQSASKKINEFQKLSKELNKVGTMMLSDTAVSKEKVTMKKLLDGKIKYQGNFNTIDDKTRNPASMGGSSSVRVNKEQMNTINAYKQSVINSALANTDYHALAGSSFMSPAQMNKTRGFVDFDLQLFRPGPTTFSAHEKRFNPYNYFPMNISSNKPIPQVDFDKGLKRDDAAYRNYKLSDPLYEHDKHLNLTHPKE